MAAAASPAAAKDHTLRVYRTKEYPKQVWWFLACLIFLVSLFHLGSVLVTWLQRRRSVRSSAAKGDSDDPEKVTQTSAQRTSSSLRMLPLALVNAYRVLAFRCTVNVGASYTLDFAEIFLTVAYIVALFTWSFINTTTQTGQKLAITYWANRTGAIAASQFPLVTVLGTKNNILSLLTGVSYDKLNFLHRMTARVAFVVLWCHAGARITMGISSDDLASVWLRCGLFGLGAFTVLCLVSLRPVRTTGYELFFYTHFVMVLIFLVGGYYHTRNFQLNSYIWPCLLFWALDRLIRLLRLSYFAVSSYLASTPHKRYCDASVDMLSPHLVRLRMNRPPGFHWGPGQTAYLTMPRVARLPFEAHPFSIASVDPTAYVGAADNNEKTDGPRVEEEGEEGGELEFLVSVREGFTKRLGAIASGRGADDRKVKVFLEGPYGTSPDVRAFESVVLVAGESGGTGVSFTLPVLLDVVNRAKGGSTVCRRVVFIWAIRDQSHIQWISESLLRALSLSSSTPDLSISIRIHVTSAQEPPPTSEAAWDNDSTHSHSSSSDPEKDIGHNQKSLAPIFANPAVQIAHGRPDLKAVMRAEMGQTRAGGRLFAGVCGSQSLAGAVRAALRVNPVWGPDSVLRGAPSVSMMVESFGYA